MFTKQGSRVGAVRNVKDGTVYLFGWGVYVGDFIPPKEVQGLFQGIKEPKIILDKGDIVWGSECWWGSEDSMKKRFKDMKLEYVSIHDFRKEGS